MKYNFLNMNGEIIETNNLSTIKKGLTWGTLNRLRPLYKMNKDQKAFLNKYGLYCSVWNVAVLQHLNIVYLIPNDYKRLKGGND